MRIVHTTQAALPDDPNKEVSRNVWNEDHTIIDSPTVNVTGGSTNEIGSSVVNPTISWSANGVMTTASITGPNGLNTSITAGASGSYQHTYTLTSNGTYTVTVGDGVETANDSTSVTFLNRRYYGATADNALSAAEILALLGTEMSKEFCSGVANTHTYDCTGGKYIWICYPASFGVAKFSIGGLEVTFNLTVQDVTNESGATASFNCYRSINLLNNSSISVVVTSG